MSHTKIPLTTIAMVSAASAKSPGVRRWPKGHPKAGKFVPKDAVITAIVPNVETKSAYKGFNRATGDNGAFVPVCKNVEFKIGEKQEITQARPIACHHGFHACENPFDVFIYYPLDANRMYGKVTLYGPFDKESNKIAAKGIVVDEILSLPHWVNTLAKYAKENPDKVNEKVSLNGSKPTHVTRFDIDVTQYLNYSRYQLSAGEHDLCQISNVNYAEQYNNTNSGIQVALGYGSKQIGYGSQISYAASVKTINLGNGSVEVLGKDCTVYLHGNSKIKAVAGTKIIYMCDDGGHVFRVGDKNAEPNKWLSLSVERMTTTKLEATLKP